MRSAIEIFCSRVVFRQRFFIKIMKWRTNTTLTPVATEGFIDSDSGECFVDFEAASEAASTLECFRQRIRSTVSVTDSLSE